MQPKIKIHGFLLLLLIGMNSYVFAGVMASQPQSAAAEVAQGQNAMEEFQGQDLQIIEENEQIAVIADHSTEDSKSEILKNSGSGVSADAEINGNDSGFSASSPDEGESQSHQGGKMFLFGCLIGLAGLLIPYQLKQ